MRMPRITCGEPETIRVSRIKLPPELDPVDMGLLRAGGDMKKGRFSEERTIANRMDSDTGALTSEFWRRHGIGANTLYHERERCGGVDASEGRRLTHLAGENARLKCIIADQVLTLRILEDHLGNRSQRHASGSTSSRRSRPHTASPSVASFASLAFRVHHALPERACAAAGPWRADWRTRGPAHLTVEGDFGRKKEAPTLLK